MKLLLVMLAVNTFTLVDISKDIGSDWVILDDGVMGGKSQSKFTIDDDNYGVFYGVVSLKNNGGFSSMRYHFNETSVEGYEKAVLRVKGDGKRYQFRVKNSLKEQVSYKYYFETIGDCQEIEILLKEMEPTLRGMKPNLPNYQAESMAEIGFLIANEKAESFELKNDKVWLK